ncbi:MAG: DMT family transporter [Candidatus Zixiibacteriota bacterium]
MTYTGELAALTTALCWSFTALFFAEAGRRVGSFRVNSIRLLFAVAIYAIVLLVSSGRLFPSDLNRTQVFYLALSGLLGLVIGDGCGFKALVMIGPRLLTLVTVTAPIMAAAIAWVFLGERLQPISLLGIVITIAGVTWVVIERRYQNHNQFNLAHDHPDAGTLARGVTLGLVAAFGQAAGLVLSKHAMLNAGSILDPLPASFLRMLTSAVMIWIYAVIRGRFGETLGALRDRPAMLYSIGGAVCGPFLGVWTSLIAVAKIPAGVAATLNATTPIWIIPNVIVFYKEKVSLRAFFGAILAVGGVAVLFMADEILGLF